jgi:methylmalonyl-CoA mutase, C-terminal domain
VAIPRGSVSSIPAHRAAVSAPGARFLLAKTSLDGHWRGYNLVARALRDGGFEVVAIGMVTAEAIATAAVQEDVDVIGLNVGGRVEVVERVLDQLAETVPEVPVVLGGTIPPWACRRLEGYGVSIFPPGSSLADIVAVARQLASRREGR